MKQILIACGDVDLLRKLVTDLPDGPFKPIATKKGGGIADKIADRPVAVAVIHEHLADDTAVGLCRALSHLADPPAILWLFSDQPPASGPFDRALRYPVAGPVFRNAVDALAPDSPADDDLQGWRTFHRELTRRLADIDQRSYFQILGIPRQAPHHRLVKAYDVLSQRYHPDRYRQLRHKKWGRTIHQQASQLYKIITEAYQVLADRTLRARYEAAVDAGNLRLDPHVQSSPDDGPTSVVDLGKTAESKKFLKLAQSDLAGNNLGRALQNLEFAQSMEPQNTALADKVAEVKRRLDN